MTIENFVIQTKLLLLFMIFALTLSGSAQLAAQGSPTFDVASIEPSNPEGRSTRFELGAGGRLNMTGVPVRDKTGLKGSYDMKLE